MTRTPGTTAKQTKSDQREQTRQTLRTALGKLLLLQAGIGKGNDDKPTEIKLDAETKSVVASVVSDIDKALRSLDEPSQSQAKAKPKPKQKQPSKAEQVWLEEAEESQREAWINKYGKKSKSKAKAEAIREAVAEAKAQAEAKARAEAKAQAEAEQ
jgi:colicin import membrane protein